MLSNSPRSGGSRLVRRRDLERWAVVVTESRLVERTNSCGTCNCNDTRQAAVRSPRGWKDDARGASLAAGVHRDPSESDQRKALSAPQQDLRPHVDIAPVVPEG